MFPEILSKKVRGREYLRRHVIITTGGVMLRGLNKRPYPGACEVCDCEDKKLEYHHWDPDNPSLGIWACSQCHKCAEGVDKGLHEKYVKLKEKIINEEPDTNYSAAYRTCPYCGWVWDARSPMPKYCACCQMTLWDLGPNDEARVEAKNDLFFKDLRGKLIGAGNG